MTIAEIFQLVGQLFGLVYAALICLVAYGIATDKIRTHASAKPVFLVIALLLLPMFASLPFQWWFFENTQVGSWWFSPTEKFLIDNLGLFSNAEKLSILDGYTFFVDQTLRAVFFDFFDVFQWSLSSLEYSHAHFFANVFVFAYRTMCSICVGALVVHLILRKF